MSSIDGLQQLRREARVAKEALAKLQQELGKLEREEAAAEAESTRWEVACQKVDADNQRLSQLFAKRIATEQGKVDTQLAAQKAELDVDMKALREEARQAVEACEALRGSEAIVKAEAEADLARVRADLEGQINPLVRTLHHREQQLEEERRIHDAEVQELRERTEPFTEQVVRVQHELQQVKADLTAKLTETEQRTLQSERRCADLVGRVQELNHRLQTANQEIIDDKDRTIRGLEHEATSLQSHFDTKLQAKNREIQKLHSEAIEYVDYIVRILPDCIPEVQEILDRLRGRRATMGDASPSSSPRTRARMSAAADRGFPQ